MSLSGRVSVGGLPVESGATGLICWAPDRPASNTHTIRKPIRFMHRNIITILCDLILRKHIVFAGILLCCGRAEAQVDSLLGRLAAAQMRHDGMFLAGTFPTLRSWAATPGDLKTDNSIFFTGLIVFTLRNLEPYLTPEERILCDSIRAR